MKKRMLTLLSLALLCGPVLAHEYWLKPEGESVILLYGHPEENESYRPEVLLEAYALTAQGNQIPVSKSLQDDGRWSLTADNAAVWVAAISNGYWSKTAEGWKHSPRSQEKEVIKATKDLHWAKLVDKAHLGFLANLPLEIVIDSVNGSQVDGRVLLRGEPVSGVKLEEDEKKIGQTDQEGRFSVSLSETGTVMLRAHYQEALEGDPEADFLNLDATIAFPL